MDENTDELPYTVALIGAVNEHNAVYCDPAAMELDLGASEFGASGLALPRRALLDAGI